MGGRGSSSNNFTKAVQAQLNKQIKTLEGVEKSVFDEDYPLTDSNIKALYKQIKLINIFREELDNAKSVKDLEKLPNGVTLYATRKLRPRYEALIARTYSQVSKKDAKRKQDMKKEADREVEILVKKYGK